MRQSSTRILNENGGSSVLVCCCKAWQLQLYKDHYYKVSFSQTSNFIFYFTGFPLYQWHICEDFLTAITEHEHTNSVVLISHCIRDSRSSYQKRLSPEYSIIAMDNSKRNAWMYIKEIYFSSFSRWIWTFKPKKSQVRILNSPSSPPLMQHKTQSTGWWSKTATHAS